MRDDNALFQEIVLDIYDTALNKDHWTNVLSKIADVVDAQGAFLFEMKHVKGRHIITAPYFSDSYEPDVVRFYLHAHNDQEIADQARFAHHSGISDEIELIGDEVLADSEAELLARDNAKTLLSYGIRHRAGALLNKDHMSIDRFALQFSEQHGPIAPDKKRLIHSLLPHVAKALNINRPTLSLESEQNLLMRSLNNLNVGVCIIRSSGEIIFRNTEFQRQLEDQSLFTMDAYARLRLSADSEQAQISAYMRDMFQHGRFGARPWKEAVTVDGKSGAVLSIEICPITPENAFADRQEGAHLIYSLDTSRAQSVNAKQIAERYALTAAEEEVLLYLAAGMSNAQIAEARSTSIETANSQVKSILAKTQTPSRAKLIRLTSYMSLSF